MSPTHIVFIHEHWLTDGSAVYSVGVFSADADREGVVTLDAVGRGEAFQLADALKASIEAKALATVEIRDRTYA